MSSTEVPEQVEHGPARTTVTPIPARRVIGLDLRISSSHHAVVVDETGRVVLRRPAASLTVAFAFALPRSASSPDPT